MLTPNEIKTILTLLDRVATTGRREAVALLTVSQKLEQMLLPETTTMAVLPSVVD